MQALPSVCEVRDTWCERQKGRMCDSIKWELVRKKIKRYVLKKKKLKAQLLNEASVSTIFFKIMKIQLFLEQNPSVPGLWTALFFPLENMNCF